MSSVALAMNATPAAKALLPEVHTFSELLYTIPVSTARAERCFSVIR